MLNKIKTLSLFTSLIITTHVFSSTPPELIFTSRMNFELPALSTLITANGKIEVIVQSALLDYSDNHAPNYDVPEITKILEALDLPNANSLIFEFNEKDCIVNEIDSRIFSCNSNQEILVTSAISNFHGQVIKRGNSQLKASGTNVYIVKVIRTDSNNFTTEFFKASIYLHMNLEENESNEIWIYLLKELLDVKLL